MGFWAETQRTTGEESREGDVNKEVEVVELEGEEGEGLKREVDSEDEEDDDDDKEEEEETRGGGGGGASPLKANVSVVVGRCCIWICIGGSGAGGKEKTAAGSSICSGKAAIVNRSTTSASIF